MALIDKVKARLGATSSYLIQVTNFDTSATTVNNTVLTAACDDSEGLFEDIVGIEADDANKVHLPHLVNGVHYFLESYKGRDSSISMGLYKRVVGGLKAFRGRQVIVAQTNSVLKPTVEKQNAKPDFDRGNAIYNTKNYKTFSIREINE